MGSRKQFTLEFKREAVQLLESGSRPTSELARELGIARNQRYKWQTELRARGRTQTEGRGRSCNFTSRVFSKAKSMSRESFLIARRDELTTNLASWH